MSDEDTIIDVVVNDGPKWPGAFVNGPENIAKVIEDLRKQRVRVNPDFTEKPRDIAWTRDWMRVAEWGEVIDATPIYRSLANDERAIDMYDRTMVPPFDMFTVAYENEHGNDIVMMSVVEDGHDERRDIRRHAKPWGQLVTPVNEVRWEEVRWAILTTVWMGGRGNGGRMTIPTTGPLYMWKSFIYGDGQPADLQWVSIVGTPEEWEMAHLVLLETLSFLSCTNIEIAEPQRPRGERRRIERTGVHVKTLMIKPTSKRSASTTGFTSAGAVPLTKVRGHFNHYGACCPAWKHEPKGLLFGKLTGKVFIPGHARGSEKYGEIDKTYVPKVES